MDTLIKAMMATTRNELAAALWNERKQNQIRKRVEAKEKRGECVESETRGRCSCVSCDEYTEALNLTDNVQTEQEAFTALCRRFTPERSKYYVEVLNDLMGFPL